MPVEREKGISQSSAVEERKRLLTSLRVDLVRYRVEVEGIEDRALGVKV